MECEESERNMFMCISQMNQYGSSWDNVVLGLALALADDWWAEYDI